MHIINSQQGRTNTISLQRGTAYFMFIYAIYAVYIMYMRSYSGHRLSARVSCSPAQ